MSRNAKNLATFVLSVLATMALLLVLCSCASTPEIRYETVEVLKPVAIAPAPLVVPGPPEIESLSADEEEWIEYLRAMVRDILSMWAHIELLHDRIEAYNEAAAEITQ